MRGAPRRLHRRIAGAGPDRVARVASRRLPALRGLRQYVPRHRGRGPPPARASRDQAAARAPPEADRLPEALTPLPPVARSGAPPRAPPEAGRLPEALRRRPLDARSAVIAPRRARAGRPR